MRGVDLIWLVIGVMVAAAHLFTGALTVLTARKTRPLDLLFAGLLFVAGWYSLFTALIHAGFALTWPWIMGAMSLLPGFIGPGLLLLTLQITRPERGIPRFAWGFLPLGGFATAYSVLMLRDPAVGRACAEALLEKRLFPDPTILLLWKLHSAQLGAFGVVSLGITLHGLIRPASPTALELTRAWIGGIFAAMGAIVVANIIPIFVHDLSSARLGPLLSLPTVAVAWHAVRRTRDLAERLEQHTNRLRPYLHKALQDLLKNEGMDSGTLSGRLVEQTLLLADIRQFTALCEKLSAVEAVQFLNQYLTTMATVIGRHGGLVDKFIGDAIFAVFPPGDGRDDAARAYDTARDMLLALDMFNSWWTGLGHEPIRVGIGLHRGRMVQGSIGSPEMKQFTVVGDTVNTVSRVEALTKELRVSILLTREVKKKLDPVVRGALRSCGTHRVAGRKEPLSLWTPSEASGGAVPEAVTAA